MSGLSLRERRLVAVALLFALIALLLYGIVLPVTDGFAERSAARTALHETYVRDERAVLQIAAIRRAAETQRRDAARFRLDGATAAAAGDRLKERAGAAITASGGDLRSVEDIAASAGTLRVRAEARLTTAQLSTVLSGLQGGAPLIVIENLSVTADQSFQTGRAGPMDVRLEISGPYPAAAPR